jgi:hypothetical protein
MEEVFFPPAFFPRIHSGLRVGRYDLKWAETRFQVPLYSTRIWIVT